jgi:hypothetical protein
VTLRTTGVERDAWLKGLKPGDAVVVVSQRFGCPASFAPGVVSAVNERHIYLKGAYAGDRQTFSARSGHRTGAYSRIRIENPLDPLVIAGVRFKGIVRNGHLDGALDLDALEAALAAVLAALVPKGVAP